MWRWSWLAVAVMGCGIGFNGGGGTGGGGTGGGAGDGGDGGAASGSTGGAGATTSQGGSPQGGGGNAAGGSGGEGGGAGFCGDGVIAAAEECDDGNQAAGDGCEGCLMVCDLNKEDAFTFKDPISFHCYYYDMDLAENRDTAVATCTSWRSGADLVAISTADEHALVENTMLAHGHEFDWFWLGGNDEAIEGVWVWNNGEIWDHENWGSGEPKPDENSQAANCAVRTGVTWSARPCNFNHRPFCEHAPPGNPL